MGEQSIYNAARGDCGHVLCRRPVHDGWPCLAGRTCHRPAESAATFSSPTACTQPTITAPSATKEMTCRSIRQVGSSLQSGLYRTCTSRRSLGPTAPPPEDALSAHSPTSPRTPGLQLTRPAARCSRRQSAAENRGGTAGELSGLLPSAGGGLPLPFLDLSLPFHCLSSAASCRLLPFAGGG